MEWSIVQLERKIEDGFVFRIVGKCEAQLNGHRYKVIDNVTLENIAGDDFINYEDLDEATVLGWYKNALGPEIVEQTENEVSEKIAIIAELENNQTEASGTPW